MNKPIFRAFAAGLLIFTGGVGFAGCTINTGTGAGSCTDTSTAGPCTGTFPCGNSGIQGACDLATQVCVVQPGSVGCETLGGTSATTCPSPAAAIAQFGCQVTTNESCTGSSTEGITINCPD
jgi:hypothetical protein